MKLVPRVEHFFPPDKWAGMRQIGALVVLLCLFSLPAAGHGSLVVNETETIAIRDFEGHEDSFPWEGFEIWDVYVGDGYDATLDADGVYFKVNFAGDGTVRPLGGAEWTIAFSFDVGEQSYERVITHDGVDVTTTFEALEWTVADGNVFQVKAWAPVDSWQGKSVRNIVLVSAVDGNARDTAPGGIHDPATGMEVPVEGPATPVFPAIGEGRIVDEVQLTGPEKFLIVNMTPKGDGRFEVELTNPLKEQGQHVHLRTPDTAWGFTTTASAMELAGAAATKLELKLTPPSTGPREPVLLDFYTDIGGRNQLYAYMADGDVHITRDATQATTANNEEPATSPGLAALLMVLFVLGLAWTQRRRVER